MESNPFRFFRNLRRSREIVAVLIRYGYADLVERLDLERYLRWGRRLLIWRKKRRRPAENRAERIRLALEALGATYIKFGQVLSTRPDLIPQDVVAELSKLQERVPPFSTKEVHEQIEQGLGKSPDELFKSFEDTPLAAGSLGQVHRAVTRGGEQVAVKIRRPSVVQTIEDDLSLMHELASLIERHIPEAQVFDPVGLVQHFSRTIRRELNFTREARTIDEFGRLFRNDATLVIPKVYWDLSSDSILTMEFVGGHGIKELDRLRELGIDPGAVAENGARIFMKQAFEFGVFHGDPHPGNIRVMPDGSICLLDYGMVGSIEETQREELVDLFMAISRNDVKRAVELVQEIGEPFREIDQALLQADVRDFVGNYYGLTLERLQVGQMLSDFVNIMAIHGIRCPGDLMLLIRAFVTLEGVGRHLDPNFNFANLLAPYVEQIVRDRYNPRRLAGRIADELQTLGKAAHEIPIYISRTLQKLSKDELKVQVDHRRLDHLMTEMDRSSNRIVVSLVMSSLIVSSALVINIQIMNIPIAVPVFLLSSFLGIWLIYGVFRSGRL